MEKWRRQRERGIEEQRGGRIEGQVKATDFN